MHSVDEALATILAHAQPLTSERVSITAALGRVLVDDIVSKREHPPWDNAAMDGYAVQWADIEAATPGSPITLRRIGEVQAGAISPLCVNRGEALQIMTGAPLPDGADTVVCIEDTQAQGNDVAILIPGQAGKHIRRRGEDVRIGTTVIPAGTTARPAEIGMLATSGHVWAQVAQRPRVAILATGDELAEPGEALRPEQIINSNSYAIAAQVDEAGGIATTLATAKDDRADLRKKIRSALGADICIIIGGVSAGKYDYVREIIKELGCEIKFRHVNMRPGYPLAFGVLSEAGPQGQKNRLLFGLPGNPVSCMVSFYQFVRPLIRQMMAAVDISLPQVTALLEQAVHHKAGRRHYARAITTYRDGHYHVRLTGDQGSGILTSMAQANSLLILPEEGGEFQAGDTLQVQLLPA